MDVEVLEKMTDREKIDLISEIWNSIEKRNYLGEKDLGKELERRRELVESRQSKLYSLEEVKSKLKKRLGDNDV